MTLLNVKEQTQTPPALIVEQQLLMPNKIWNWHVSQTGFLPKEMINFVDTLPISCATTGRFNFSANRLFENYALLLDLVDNSFQPQAALNAAKQSIQRPSFSPNSDNEAPLGWAKTNDGANMIRWTPSYSISAWPASWLAEIKTQGNNPQIIRLPLVDNCQQSLLVTDKDAHQQNINICCSDDYLEISALAWNRVKITPGSWLNSGLIQLLKNQQNCFVTGYDQASIFGPTGLLNCRVSELLVAYKPEIKLLGDQHFVQQHESALMNAKQISLGAIDLSNPTKQKLNNNQNLYTLSSASEQAIIVAVNVIPV